MYITAPCFEAEKYITGRKTYITGRRNYITALKRTTSEVVKPTSRVSPISASDEQDKAFLQATKHRIPHNENNKSCYHTAHNSATGRKLLKKQAITNKRYIVIHRIETLHLQHPWRHDIYRVKERRAIHPCRHNNAPQVNNVAEKDCQRRE